MARIARAVAVGIPHHVIQRGNRRQPMFFYRRRLIEVSLVDSRVAESYAKAFPFDKMVSDMLDPEMIEDTVKIVTEDVKDKVQVNLIINSRAGGNGPLIARQIIYIVNS